MKANLNVEHLQFQYIGLINGLFINYPSTRLSNCDSYDPRFRYIFSVYLVTIDEIKIQEYRNTNKDVVV